MAGATDSSPLLEEARSYRLSAAAARALAARMGPEPPWDEVRTAVSERDQTTAQLLMVAASVAGFRVPGALLRETVHLLDQSDLVLPFVGEAGGDPLALIEGLLEEPYLASQIGNDLCALSALILEGRPPPPSLLGAVRAWVFQQHLDPDGQLAEAVARLGDAELQAFVRARGFQTTSVSRGMLEFVRASWLMAPVSILEDHEALTPSPAVSTKIGRNEPCPCGSGKKFKKCCADKPSVPAIPRREPIPQGAISDVELVGLSDFECVRLRLEALSTSQRYMVFMRFLVRRWWKEARAVLEAVQRTRGSSPAEIAGLWADLARMALECGEETVARDAANQIAPEARSPELEARFEIRQPSPILDQLEALALSGLRAEDEDAVPEALHNLAFILLDHRPALGILVARAAIAPNRVFDSEVLLSDIDAARSNLGLSPGDRAEDIFDLFASGDTMESTDSSAHRAEAEAAKAQLATAAARARTLEAELDKQRRALEAERARPTETPAVDSAEVQRLRQKIADLKGLVSEHAAERGRLRSELKSLTASKPAAAPAAPMPTEPEAEPGVPSGAAERRRILTPVYAAAAEEALRAVPRHVASAALVLAANLAAGDEAAWVNTKVLAAVSELRSARVGIHHRLLFRVDASRGRLELVDLCSRSDLEKVLKRLGGS